MDRPALPDLTAYSNSLRGLKTTRISGKVVQVVGLTIEAVGLDCQIGEVCEIRANAKSAPLLTEVVGFRNERVLLMPLGEMQGIQLGSPIYPLYTAFRAPVGMSLLGRVLDGLGQPIDGLGPLSVADTVSTYAPAPHPLQRQPIDAPLVTGVRAIDGLLTCAKGQRMGIFAGSGVGKSTLLGAIAPRRVLFPTPLPAKMPILCPFAQVNKPSIARTPVTRGSSMGWRCNGCGAGA